MKISWFSAGVSSAVATKIANPDRIIYIDIDDQHPDTYRFLADCEKWFGKKVEVLKSPLCSVENTCLAASFIRGPHGAACTTRLKKRVRKEWEYANPIKGRYVYVWGIDREESDRAYGYYGIVNTMPDFDHLFPIIDKTKAEVHGVLEAAGIKRPAMYDMGYNNNNCIGCVKGGMGYWNKIRIDFPEVFARRAAMERKIGAHILKECYLDELDPKRGRDQKIIIPDCGLFCQKENEDARVETEETAKQCTTAAVSAFVNSGM
jgi:3'-phosphoadenosine 5'-phosphosulfate sulfotransferase (PAPS reductase)/FAD synthetase